MARTAQGWISADAEQPALMTSKRSPAWRLKSPSAIWLLAEFWVHKSSTFFFLWVPTIRLPLPFPGGSRAASFAPHHPPTRPRAARPTAPPPTTSQAELTLKRTSSTSAATPIEAENGSTTVARPSCHVTPAMSARDATLTPSSMPEKVGDRLRRPTYGAVTATKTKAGRKMPKVATAAPARPRAGTR